MKVTFSCESVLNAVQSVIGAVAKKSSLPILTHVLIVADGSQWKVTGSDLELSLIAKIDLESEPFSVCLSAKKLLDVLKSFAKDAIVGMSLDDGKATIRSGRSRFVSNTLPAEDYPQIAFEKLTPIATLDQEVLSKLIRSTSHAMAQQDVRYYLNGLCFDFNQFELNVIGTDGHRLSINKTELSEPVLKKELIVPRNSIEELNKILVKGSCKLYGSSSEYVNSGDIAVTMNTFVVELDNLMFITKLIDGRFPDWRRVVPKEQSHKVRFDRKFYDAINRVGLILDKTNQGIAVEFEKDQLRLSARSYEEEAEEFLDIDSDAEVAIGLNAFYLQDAMDAIDNEDILLSFSDSTGSVKIESVEQDECVCVIMPMRL